MKRIFLFFAFFVLSSPVAFADFGLPSNGYSRVNVYGGTNYYDRGQTIYSRPNVFGGYNYYRQGKLETYSRPGGSGIQVFRSWNSGSKK